MARSDAKARPRNEAASPRFLDQFVYDSLDVAAGWTCGPGSKSQNDILVSTMSMQQERLNQELTAVGVLILADL
jgi:hypothetical protein